MQTGKRHPFISLGGLKISYFFFTVLSIVDEMTSLLKAQLPNGNVFALLESNVVNGQLRPRSAK